MFFPVTFVTIRHSSSVTVASLCKDCVSKHTDEFKSVSHEIAPFLDRKIQLVFSECQNHSGQRCEVYCEDCNKPVCVKCILSGPHKGHNAEELTDAYEKRRREIKTETQEIRDHIIPTYQKEDADIRMAFLKMETTIDDSANKRKTLRQLWHQEVDNIFDQIDLRSLSLIEENLNDLKGYQKKIQNVIYEMNETVKQNENILNSNSLSAVKTRKSKLKEYRRLPEKVDMRMPSLITKIERGKELSIEIDDDRPTVMQKYQPSQQACVSLWKATIREQNFRIVATIHTNHTPLKGVVSVGKAEAWIFGKNRTITRIDIQGFVISTFSARTVPDDISATRNGELLYGDTNNGTVNIVREGKSQILIKYPSDWDWRPNRLCCTKFGKIHIHMSRESCLNDIHVTYDKIDCHVGERVVKMFDQDHFGNHLFQTGSNSLYMSDTNYEGICVSDTNAKSVIRVDMTGRVCFRYGGTQPSFNPRGIVMDDLKQIIVADIGNNCLHVIDQKGQFLRFIDDSGLEKPMRLSLDNDGKLWVGLYDSGTIKVIKY